MARWKMSNAAVNIDSISKRAAAFLEVNYSGAHKDKRIARVFGISPAMARILRAGRGWTVGRLDQAVASFGKPFCDAIWPPPTDEIREELAHIRRCVDELMGRGKDE